MKIRWMIAAGAVTFFLAVAIWLNGQQQAQTGQPVAPHVQPPPILTLPTATPAWLLVGSPTVVTITIPIANPLVIPIGVNLLQVGANGTSTVLGVFHDDGINGDIAANDGIYSIRMPFKAAAAGSTQLQVSAAFKGSLKRILSPVLSLYGYLMPPPLPPDPGTAGKTALQGIDSDHDGVRDDVQRYITLTFSASAKTRSALTQVAKAQLALINDSADSSLSQLDALELAYGIECLSVSTNGDLQSTLSSLEDQVFNTSQRFKAYINAEGQVSGFSLKLSSVPSSRCIISPSTLPN